MNWIIPMTMWDIPCIPLNSKNPLIIYRNGNNSYINPDILYIFVGILLYIFCDILAIPFTLVFHY